MKKFKILFVLALCIITLSGVSAVHAQTSTTEDSQIRQSLEQEGVSDAPAPVKVEGVELRGSKPYSGFVDENGKPMSDEEYSAWKDSQKGLFKKYPWLLPATVLGLGAGVFVITKARKK